MTKLQEFKALDTWRHNPAIGCNFGKSNLCRLLIVGLSHYSPNADQIRDPKFTHNLLDEVIRGDVKIPYFSKIASLFQDPNGQLYSPAEFYPLVAFYNYLPDHFKDPKLPIREDLYTTESTVEFFYMVLKEIKPTHVLITGKSLWRMLPSTPQPKPEKNLKLPLSGNLHADERHAWWYPTGGDNHALVAGIYHPSSFSFNAKEIRQWTPNFLRYSEKANYV